MGFKTKLDYSDNRQIKQHLETLTTLSGGTSFGITFADLTKGPNLATSGETENYDLIASTFSGNNTTTIYTWYDPRMELGHPYLSALTPTNSAETQTVNPVFASSASVIIDGNLVNTAFTGVTFDLENIIMTDLGGGNYAGTVEHSFFDVLSAATAEFTGRTIWADVSGITRTERLIVTNNPTVGYVLTCNDTEGMASWAPSSGSGVDIRVTGGTYSAGTAIFTNNTGGTFNVTGFSTGSGGTSYWSAGTALNSVVILNSSNIASGDFSLAEGNFTTASGSYAHAEGYQTNANGYSSHAQGYQTTASGYYTHAGGQYTQANGLSSFVHGYNSQANGNYSIVLGRNITGSTADTTYVDSLNIKTVPVGTSVNNLGIDINGRVVVGSAGGSGTTNYWSAGTGTDAIVTLNSTNLASNTYAVAINSGTTASGQASFASGSYTIAGGDGSHAEGGYTTASGLNSHAEGYWSIASGEFDHAEGNSTLASGSSSHAEGNSTLAGGNSSHAEGRFTTASGNYSHAEGNETLASNDGNHAGGYRTKASGQYSFIHGSNSVVNSDYSIVLGRDITGSTADTTYVDGLNIKTIPSGPGTIDIGVNASGFVVNQASDRRLKENINTIENALDMVLKLRGVSYNWKDRVNGGDNLRLGFIAQEVQEVVPELVSENGEYLGVQYKDIPALLVEAIKELVEGYTGYTNTFLETQTIQAEDNNIELNYNGTIGSSIGGGVTVLRGRQDSTNLLIDADGYWVSNVNILSKGFVIPEYTPTNSQDSKGIIGNIVQDDDYIYIKRNSGWKRTPKLENF
jgi:hypothetical protein